MVASFAVHVSSDIGCARHEVRVIYSPSRAFWGARKEGNPGRSGRSCWFLFVSQLITPRATTSPFQNLHTHTGDDDRGEYDADIGAFY